MTLEDIAAVFTWALCAGIPLAVALFTIFLLIRTLWIGFRKKRALAEVLAPETS